MSRIGLASRVAPAGIAIALAGCTALGLVAPVRSDDPRLGNESPRPTFVRPTPTPEPAVWPVSGEVFEVEKTFDVAKGTANLGLSLALRQGDFLAMWIDAGYYSIAPGDLFLRVRRIDGAGSLKGEEGAVRAPLAFGFSQVIPTLDETGYLATWATSDSGSTSVVVQALEADGAASGSPLVFADDTFRPWLSPTKGGYLLWRREGSDVPSRRLVVSRLDAALKPAGDSVPVAAGHDPWITGVVTATETGEHLVLAGNGNAVLTDSLGWTKARPVLPTGYDGPAAGFNPDAREFLVAWTSKLTLERAKAVPISTGGAVLGEPIVVSESSVAAVDLVAYDSSTGQYVMAFRRDRPPPPCFTQICPAGWVLEYDLLVRRLDASGKPVGPEVVFAETVYDSAWQFDPATGRFMVLWQSGMSRDLKGALIRVKPG